MGDEVVGHLENNDPHIRDGALAALTSVAVVANTVVLSALVARLESNEAFIRHAAVQALQLVSPCDSEKIDLLLPHLAHSDSEVRCGILRILDEGFDRSWRRAVVSSVWP